ncbi:MAG TPA: F0F1 ATP synthase subunit B [Pseudonocardiaceae bacterium]|jgi:ATP synthase F0 subunit b|nr:F0F1 ATP synthase subunit B [Pseudonocardiaceae bacterium]
MVATYISQLVGFALVVAVIWWKVVPPVRKAMRRQKDLIAKQVEDAEVAGARLAEAERKYRDALTEARTEAAKIRDAARADAIRIVEEMREQADREVERIRERGEAELVAQRRQVIRDLRSRIGELAVDLAGELVTEHLSDPQRRSATVDRLLDELESMAATSDATGEDS